MGILGDSGKEAEMRGEKEGREREGEGVGVEEDMYMYIYMYMERKFVKNVYSCLFSLLSSRGFQASRSGLTGMTSFVEQLVMLRHCGPI